MADRERKQETARNPEVRQDLPPDFAPGTRVVLGLFILLAFTAACIRLLSSSPQMSWSDVDLSPPDWALNAIEQQTLRSAITARHEQQIDFKHPTVEGLLKAFTVYNTTDAQSGGDKRNRELADRHAHYQQWALTTLDFLGPDRYVALGQSLAVKMLKALKDRDLETLKRYGGTFIQHIQLTGLIDVNLQPVSSDALWVIQAALMMRWGRTVQNSRSVEHLLSHQERVLLLRWKLAANPLVDKKRREVIAAELALLDSSYPVAEALASRAANDGDWLLAGRYYRDALKREPLLKRLQANVAYAEVMANRHR